MSRSSALNRSKAKTEPPGSAWVAIPVALLFLFLQRHIIEGLKAGANKG